MAHGVGEFHRTCIETGVELQAGLVGQALCLDGGLGRIFSLVGALERGEDVVAVGLDEEAAALARDVDHVGDQRLEDAPGLRFTGVLA